MDNSAGPLGETATMVFTADTGPAMLRAAAHGTWPPDGLWAELKAG